MASVNTYALLKTRVSPVSFDGWLALIGKTLEQKTPCQFFAHHNLHSLYLYQKEPLIREFYAQSTHCYIDGVPVRWLLAAAGHSTNGRQRFSLMDNFELLLQEAERRGWSIFYLGGAPEASELAADKINKQFPNLSIALHHGYFDLQGDENATLVDAINAFSPDLLLVGMGMPRQEAWLLENRKHLTVGIATQTGATLDYYVDWQARPPQWMSDAGLGGWYRLVHDPRRLWRRYLLEPWVLLWQLLLMWWRD